MREETHIQIGNYLELDIKKALTILLKYFASDPSLKQSGNERDVYGFELKYKPANDVKLKAKWTILNKQKKNIIAVHEFAEKSNVDTHVQGLPGRMCGYFHAQCLIFCNTKLLEKYIDVCENGADRYSILYIFIQKCIILAKFAKQISFLF